MRVLVLTQYFWPENFAINHLSVGLAENGCDVDVLTGMPNYPEGQIFKGYGGFRSCCDSYKGLRVVRVPMMPRGSSRLSLATNYVSFPVSASLLGRRFLKPSYDVVLVYAPSPATIGLAGLALKKQMNSALAFWVQDLWPESLSAAGGLDAPIVLRSVNAMVRRIYQGSDVVLLSSRGFEGPILAAGGDRRKLRYVPNTVEQHYRPIHAADDAPERSELPRDGFKIVFGGNLGEAQGLETALKAAALLRHRGDIHWIFIGEGRAQRELIAMRDALELQDCVHFIGSRPAAKMPSYFACADALLLSLRAEPIFELTVPSKLQAYLACGRPVLASLGGEGARLVMEAHAGSISEPGNPQALAQAALRMSDSSDADRRQMATSARLYFEAHFSRRRVIELLLGSLQDAVRAFQGR